MLDKLSSAQRHAALLLLAGILGTLSTNIDLFGLADGIKPIVVALITVALAWITPLVKAYGVGQEPVDTTEVGQVGVIGGETVGEVVDDADPEDGAI